jgi:Ca2+-binding EF-hand superfamily protein
LCCIGVFAQGEPSPQTPTALDAQADAEEFESVRAEAFARLDADSSGSIELAEWPGRKKAFRLLDVNRDGGITLVEFQSKKARWWKQVFENLDLDGNRAITRAEWMDIAEDFDRLDYDKNGIIDRREFYNLH